MFEHCLNFPESIPFCAPPPFISIKIVHSNFAPDKSAQDLDVRVIFQPKYRKNYLLL